MADNATGSKIRIKIDSAELKRENEALKVRLEKLEKRQVDDDTAAADAADAQAQAAIDAATALDKRFEDAEDAQAQAALDAATALDKRFEGAAVATDKRFADLETRMTEQEDLTSEDVEDLPFG